MSHYPNLNGLVDPSVARAIKILYDRYNELQRERDPSRAARDGSPHSSPPGAGLSPARASVQPSEPSIIDIQTALEGTGDYPLNVTGLLGQLAEAQVARVPKVSALPSLDDPLSQDGVLILVGTTKYRFDGSTNPGTWQLF